MSVSPYLIMPTSFLPLEERPRFKDFSRVEVTPFYDNRTQQQNRYYWFCLEHIAKYVGQYSPLGWHDFFKNYILKIKHLIVNDHEIVFSTAWLNRKDFNWYLKEIKHLVWNHYNLNLPDPEDLIYQAEKTALRLNR